MHKVSSMPCVHLRAGQRCPLHPGTVPSSPRNNARHRCSPKATDTYGHSTVVSETGLFHQTALFHVHTWRISMFFFFYHPLDPLYPYNFSEAFKLKSPDSCLLGCANDSHLYNTPRKAKVLQNFTLIYLLVLCHKLLMLFRFNIVQPVMLCHSWCCLVSASLQPIMLYHKLLMLFRLTIAAASHVVQ